jgi:hydroxyacylglutathione hydrolase
MLQIDPIPAFDDNYIWLLRQGSDPRVTVVDPGDGEPVIEALRREGLELATVLITHHHQDHIGGLAELMAVWPNLRAIGPKDRRIPGLSRIVGEGNRVMPNGPALEFGVIEVPGHTSTHIAYVGAGLLFCGDTLFAGGCGRVFDGTFEQLAASLRRIAALPAETRCYCAHEYTEANLGFAAWVEPDSPELARRQADVAKARAADRPTVPSIIGDELATNPFLRTREPAVVAAATAYAGQDLADETAVFTALRRWKDERYD